MAEPNPPNTPKTGLHAEEAAQAANQNEDDVIFILGDEDGAPAIELAESVGRPPTPEDVIDDPQLEDALNNLLKNNDETTT